MNFKRSVYHAQVVTHARWLCTHLQGGASFPVWVRGLFPSSATFAICKAQNPLTYDSIEVYQPIHEQQMSSYYWIQVSTPGGENNVKIHNL